MPVYVTESDPKVIAAYKIYLPGRKIFVLPPDAVSERRPPQHRPKSRLPRQAAIQICENEANFWDA